MVQILLNLDIVENSIAKRFCQKWELSKADTIKRIMREFRKCEREMDKEAEISKEKIIKKEKEDKNDIKK